MAVAPSQAHITPPLVQDATQGAAHNPPRIARPFLANWSRAAPCAHRVAPLDPIPVCATPHGRRREKAGGPRRVRLAEPGQAGTLRHWGNQRHRVARQPALASPGASAWDGIQPGQRHDCTGIPCGVRGCGHSQPLLVYRLDQCDNTIWGSHRTGSSGLKLAQPQLEPVRDALSMPPLDATYQTNTIGDWRW